MAKIETVSRKSHHTTATLFITKYDFVFNSISGIQGFF